MGLQYKIWLFINCTQLQGLLLQGFFQLFAQGRGGGGKMRFYGLLVALSLNFDFGAFIKCN